ncbi:MAG: ATP-binding protein [Planctomycetes bacterium]|nr:ATP-binding protein [Planctomycetota bacterium]
MSRRTDEALKEQARRLGLWGLLANWETLGRESWVRDYLDTEDDVRQQRSLERRVRNAKLGRFKTMADFDWQWPEKIDRDHVDDVLGLGFMDENANVVIAGPNGVGKTTIAQNLGYQALMKGHTVLRVTASEMLNDLAAQESSVALARRLRRYCNPALLIVDEIGYLSYDSRYGDLLFEVVSRRHELRSTVLTTNKAFSEWTEVFSNASCVTALIDRLVHRAEIVKIEGRSYREKEAHERNARRAAERGRKSRAAKARS